MENSKNIKSWSQMTKEEKQEAMKDIAKLRGYAKSWKEISEYYNSVETTIKQAYNTFVKTTEKTEKSCKEILNESTVNISDELLTNLLERIERIELEVATVKKIQVERASIERLDETEYNYFIYEGDKEISKFKTAEECSNYCKSVLGFNSNASYIERMVESNNGSFKLRNYRIVQSFKRDNDRLERENAAVKSVTENLTKRLKEIEGN